MAFYHYFVCSHLDCLSCQKCRNCWHCHYYTHSSTDDLLEEAFARLNCSLGCCPSFCFWSPFYKLLSPYYEQGCCFVSLSLLNFVFDHLLISRKHPTWLRKSPPPWTSSDCSSLADSHVGCCWMDASASIWVRVDYHHVPTVLIWNFSRLRIQLQDRLTGRNGRHFCYYLGTGHCRSRHSSGSAMGHPSCSSCRP